MAKLFNRKLYAQEILLIKEISYFT